jgi:hypothetical protein
MSRPPKNHHRELIELAALFAAGGLADLFTNLLGHRIEGPSILIALGAVVAAVTFARQQPIRRGRAMSAQAARAPLPERPGCLPEASGRLWRVRTMVEDRPGRLAVLAGAFAAVGANILTLQVHPVADGAVDEFLVQAAPDVTPRRLGAAVAAAGGGQVHVEAADVTALADVPTRALTLAHRLTGDPGDLGRVLLELLGATDVVWRPSSDQSAEASHAESGTESIAIAVSKPRPGVMVVSRAQVPFTLVEFARAQAMADLAGALHLVGEPSRG